MSRARGIGAAAGALLVAFAPALATGQVAPPPPKPEPASTGGSDGFVWESAAPSAGAPPVAADERPSAPPAIRPGEFAWWWEAPAGSAESAARLFDQVCLATLPHFTGAGALFEALGFAGQPGMRIRNHPQKEMSALAMTPEEIEASGVRSCAVLVGDLDEAQARRAVEPIVRSRFGAVRRYEVPGGEVAHVVWTVETPAGPARLTVTESGGSAFLGATVLTAHAGAEP